MVDAKGPTVMSLVYFVYLFCGPISGILFNLKCGLWLLQNPRAAVATLLQIILFPLYIFFFGGSLAVAGLMPYLFWLWIILIPITGYSMYNLLLRIFGAKSNVCLNYLQFMNILGSAGAVIISCLGGFILNHERDIAFWKWGEKRPDLLSEVMKKSYYAASGIRTHASEEN